MAEVASKIDMGHDLKAVVRNGQCRLRAALAVTLGLVLGAKIVGCRPHPWDQPHPGWKTFRTPHFVVHTDVRPSAQNAVLDRLEETRAALGTIVFPEVDPGLVEVLLLSERDFVALLGEEKGGVFISEVGALGGVLVVRDGGDPDKLVRTTAHELTHRFLAEGYPALPPWLSEGIAGYLETMDVRGAEVVFGLAAPRGPSGSPGTPTLLSLRELAHADHDAFYRGPSESKYEAAHVFIHWLLHGRDLDGWAPSQARWKTLLSPYRRGAPSDEGPDGVMARVLPQLTWTEIQARAETHARRLWGSSIPMIYVVPFSPPAAPTPAVAPARPAEVKTLARTVLAAREGRAPCRTGTDDGFPCPEDRGVSGSGSLAAICYAPGVLASKTPSPPSSDRLEAASWSEYLERVQAELSARVPALAECAEVLAATRGKPPSVTQATVLVLISGDGTVAQADVALVGGPDAEVAACIAEVACGWSFSPPPAGQDPIVRRSFPLGPPATPRR